VTTVFGIDGEYVDSQRLMIADADYRADDLTKRIDLGTRFDLVQSLEVAEHLAPAAAETFINNLTRHGDVILFSAALPGQGGIHHVNEQPFSYWRRKFAARGYQAYDPLRPLIRDNNEVAWWYRYGVLIYANEDGLAALPELSEIFEAEISANVPIGDPSPMALRWRRKLMRQLPRPLVEMITRAYMKRLESASTVTSKR